MGYFLSYFCSFVIMIIKTKKYRLPKSKYLKTSFLNLMIARWWIMLLLFIAMVSLFSIGYNKWGIFAVVVFVGYILLCFLQVYAVTLVKENKMIFERFSYQISSKQIIMQMSSKQGMTIGWDQIKKVKKKKGCFTLFINLGQFIYLPKHIFNNPQERKFLTILLKRKKLLN